MNLYINKKEFLFFLSSSLACMFFIFSCNNISKKKKVVVQDIDVSILQQMEPVSALTFDSTTANQFFNKYPLLDSIKKDWFNFYRERSFSFAWVDSNGLNVAAQNLHNRINNLSDDGFTNPLAYRIEFNQLFDDASLASRREKSYDSTFINTEMMLSAQYFLYARKIYGSFTEEELKELGWNIRPKKVSYDEYLNSILNDTSKNIFDNEPVFAQYGLLKKQLQLYRSVESSGGWPMVDTVVKKLKPGDSSKIISAVKQRLAITGDFGKNDTGKIFNQSLATAIKQFRKSHGLKDTTILDKQTILEMNVPVKKRMEQILVNMQRSRWIPGNTGGDYIVVNIPDYKLHVFEDGKLLFSMDVVVGQETNKTVVFNDTLTTIAFSPYWNVPYSIYKKELSNKSDAYLRRNNFEMVSPGKLRQKPGGDNALGLVKFLFPNSYNIYFHDTPAKDKFNYTQRAFSHGCIRLSEPVKLAGYLLRSEPKYTPEIIDSLMHLDKEVQVKIKKPVPVYIGYLTAFVNSEGILQFRKDIYKQDEAVLNKIINR